jgi:hypothetical protein
MWHMAVSNTVILPFRRPLNASELHRYMDRKTLSPSERGSEKPIVGSELYYFYCSMSRYLKIGVLVISGHSASRFNWSYTL